MDTTAPATYPQPGAQPDAQRSEALRWVRKKRTLYTIVAVYAVLSVMWFSIDMADGTENLWFYWPMIGVGSAIAIAAVIMFGVGGLFDAGWERRQVERYLEQQRVTRSA